MELFTIVIMKVDESYVRSLSAQIERELQLLHIVESGWTIAYEWTETHAYIRLESKLTDKENSVLRGQMMPNLAGVLADHIIADKESSILRNLLIKRI